MNTRTKKTIISILLWFKSLKPKSKRKSIWDL